MRSLALRSIDLLLLDQKHYLLPVDQSAMSATLPHELLDSLRDLASATTRTDCTTRISAHLERLFPGLGASALELAAASARMRGGAVDRAARRAGATTASCGWRARRRSEDDEPAAARCLRRACGARTRQRPPARGPRPPRAARSAHRAAQPRRVPRDAHDRGCALRRPSRRAAEPGGLRPRPLQGRQRRRRPRRRRPPAARDGRDADRRQPHE